MFDTMTMTKVLGAVCGSLLVFLLGSWAATALFDTGGGHGGEAASRPIRSTPARRLRRPSAAEEARLSTSFMPRPMRLRAKRCSPSARPATRLTAPMAPART